MRDLFLLGVGLVAQFSNRTGRAHSTDTIMLISGEIRLCCNQVTLNKPHYVQKAVLEAARATGQELFAFDEVDGVDYLADDKWQAARSLAAAVALAAGTVDHSAEAALLARRWIDIVGPPHTDSGL